MELPSLVWPSPLQGTTDSDFYLPTCHLPWDSQMGPHIPPPFPQLAPFLLGKRQVYLPVALVKTSLCLPSPNHPQRALPSRFSIHPPLPTPSVSTPGPATTISPSPRGLEQCLACRCAQSILPNDCMEHVPMTALQRMCTLDQATQCGDSNSVCSLRL